MSNENYDDIIKAKLSKETLQHDYCDLFLNVKEIALKYNLTRCAIGKLIKLYNITRDSNKAISVKNKKAKSFNYEDIKKRISKEDLYYWYIEQDNSYANAPKHYNISQWMFDKLCRDYNIRKDKHKTYFKGLKTKENNAGGRSNYNEKILSKRNKTVIEKYGSIEQFNKIRSQSLRKTWELNHEDILGKITLTKSKNNSFNVSNPEISYYNYLVDKYGLDNVKTQYNTDSRYPFNCDFYIKSEDLFIELNLHWSHGGHLFTGSDEDLKILGYWKKKSEASKFYQNAIDVWTRRDPEKYSYFIKNKLNFKIIYDKEDMYE